jgi:CPA1 family monovalent cation:H+ antiporter
MTPVAASSLPGGSVSSVEATLVVLLMLAMAIAVFTARYEIPYTVGLVVVGLLVGLVSRPSAVRFSTDVVFYVFLPAILFEASFNLNVQHLFRHWRGITVLAVPGVLISFGLTTLGMHYVGAEAWSIALLFGALIAATDPVSVVALFRRLGVVPRLTTVIEAESLLNDGTAAVVFVIVLSSVLGERTVDPAGALWRFVWMAGGGLLVGLVAGRLATVVHKRVDDHLTEITLSAVLAYGSFLLAQRLEMSGVVACVTAGLVLGRWRHEVFSPASREAAETFWEFAAFVVNSLIFLLIGLEINLGVIRQHAGLAILGFVVVVGARAIVVYGYGFSTRFSNAPVPMAWQHALWWGGLRGTVALALVLSIPPDYQGSALLVATTFGVVLLSLLVGGLTMRPFARSLGLMVEEQ